MTAEALEIATPERVNVSLPIAGIGYRTLAYLADLGLFFTFWVVLYFALTLLRTNLIDLFQALSGLLRTVALVGVFATQWVYWTACEVFFDGQTLGKRAAGIRVVREDGAPVDLLESAVRNLCRAIDFLPLLYAGGVLCMLVTQRHQRVGDLLAGTLLVRAERIDLDKYARSPEPGFSAPSLPAADVELILGFLSRAGNLAPDARQRLANALVDRFAQGLTDDARRELKASLPAAEAFLSERARART